MFPIWSKGSSSSSLLRQLLTWSPLETHLGTRHASKKAQGSSRNPKASKGQGRGVKRLDGCFVHPGDILATQRGKLNWHGGLNVGIVSRHTLIALKSGRVVITSEKPDLDMNHWYNYTYYSGTEGKTFYKKYFHVIPPPQHNRFKLIKEV